MSINRLKGSDIVTNNMFDDFVIKAKDVADVATKKTGELYEISKYKYETIKINGDLKKLYERLGKSVYSMVKENYNNEDLVNSLTSEIDELLARLDVLKEKIAETKHVRVCKACGTNNPEDSIYCSKCGSKIKSQFNGEEKEPKTDDLDEE